jgi:hypothetical protein
MKEDFNVEKFQLIKQKFIQVDLIKCEMADKDDNDRIFWGVEHTWLFLDEELANQFIQSQNSILEGTEYKKEGYFYKSWHKFQIKEKEIRYYGKKY